ncbi:MAG: hypothetical protein HRU09_15985 [Oligoflexales bacterium]|nr:hypothetical protein [Oligoflexales bacterium]
METSGKAELGEQINRMGSMLNFDNVSFVNANDFVGTEAHGQTPIERLESFLKACVGKLDRQRGFIEAEGMISRAQSSLNEVQKGE